MIKKECGTCYYFLNAFYINEDTEEKFTEGECCRYPKIITKHHYQWCGEYKLDEPDVEFMEGGVGQLYLSEDLFNIFAIKDIETIKDLINNTPEELRQYKGIGRKKIRQIQESLKLFNLSLKDE